MFLFHSVVHARGRYPTTGLVRLPPALWAATVALAEAGAGATTATAATAGAGAEIGAGAEVKVGAEAGAGAAVSHEAPVRRTATTVTAATRAPASDEPRLQEQIFSWEDGWGNKINETNNPNNSDHLLLLLWSISDYYS